MEQRYPDVDSVEWDLAECQIQNDMLQKRACAAESELAQALGRIETLAVSLADTIRERDELKATADRAEFVTEALGNAIDRIRGITKGWDNADFSDEIDIDELAVKIAAARMFVQSFEDPEED